MLSAFMTPEGRIGWIDLRRDFPDVHRLVINGEPVTDLAFLYAKIIPLADGRFVVLRAERKSAPCERPFEAWLIDPKNEDGYGIEQLRAHGPMDDAIVTDEGHLVTFAFPPPMTVTHDLTGTAARPVGTSPWEFVRDVTSFGPNHRRAFVGRVPGASRETWYEGGRPVIAPFDAVGPLTEGQDGRWFFRAATDHMTYVVTLDD